MNPLPILLLILFSCITSNAQTQGSDIIILIDANKSVNTAEYSDMLQSIRNVITKVKECNPDNRFATVKYGAETEQSNVTKNPISKIIIESDFSETFTLINETNSEPPFHGEYLHDAFDLLDIALDSDKNNTSTRIIDKTNRPSNDTNFRKLTRTTNGNELIIWIFTDSYRADQIIMENSTSTPITSKGSYLVNYSNSDPITGDHPNEFPLAHSGNDAMTNFTSFKNKNAKFIVTHLPPDIASQKAASSIASGGKTRNYQGPFEFFENDPDLDETSRYYFPRESTQGFKFSDFEIQEIKQAFCEVSTGASITLDSVNINCPSINFKVTGSFKLKNSQKPSYIKLYIKDSSETQLPDSNLVATINNENTFSFTLDPNIHFGSNPIGKYYFEVIMSFYSTLPTINFIGSDIYSKDQANVIFDNCCSIIYETPDHIQNTTDIQKAANLLLANKSIDSTSIVTYSAPTIKLQKGFKAVKGSIVRLRNDFCNQSITPEVQSPPFKYRIPQYFFNPKTETNKRLFSIYPNPSNGLFNINLNKDSTTIITVTTINGRTILNQTYNDDEITIDLTHFSKGVYILQIKSSNNIITRKIIKK